MKETAKISKKEFETIMEATIRNAPEVVFVATAEPDRSGQAPLATIWCVDEEDESSCARPRSSDPSRSRNPF
jgi:hypothetical protein